MSNPVEIIEWMPLHEFRYYTRDAKLIPPVLQGRFKCKASDGTSGEIWAEVNPDSPFYPVGIK